LILFEIAGLVQYAYQELNVYWNIYSYFLIQGLCAI
jgi:hypothetical protein